jgi:hypothetical protein
MTIVLASGLYRSAKDRLLEFFCRAFFLSYVPWVLEDLRLFAPTTAWLQFAETTFSVGLVYLVVRTLVDLAEDLIDTWVWFRPKHALNKLASLEVTQPERIRYDRDVDERPLRSIQHWLRTAEMFAVAAPLFLLWWAISEHMQFCLDRQNYLLTYFDRMKCMYTRFALGLGCAAIGMRNGAAAVPLLYRMFGVTSWRAIKR